MILNTVHLQFSQKDIVYVNIRSNYSLTGVINHTHYSLLEDGVKICSDSCSENLVILAEKCL